MGVMRNVAVTRAAASRMNARPPLEKECQTDPLAWPFHHTWSPWRCVSSVSSRHSTCRSLQSTPRPAPRRTRQQAAWPPGFPPASPRPGPRSPIFSKDLLHANLTVLLHFTLHWLVYKDSGPTYPPCPEIAVTTTRNLVWKLIIFNTYIHLKALVSGTL